MTKRVNVYFETVASAVVYVDVPDDADEDEILDEAYNELPGGLCAQCSGWGHDYGVDLGEWNLSKPAFDFPNDD